MTQNQLDDRCYGHKNTARHSNTLPTTRQVRRVTQTNCCRLPRHLGLHSTSFILSYRNELILSIKGIKKASNNERLFHLPISFIFQHFISYHLSLDLNSTLLILRIAGARTERSIFRGVLCPLISPSFYTLFLKTEINQRKQLRSFALSCMRSRFSQNHILLVYYLTYYKFKDTFRKCTRFK